MMISRLVMVLLVLTKVVICADQGNNFRSTALSNLAHFLFCLSFTLSAHCEHEYNGSHLNYMEDIWTSVLVGRSRKFVLTCDSV